MEFLVIPLWLVLSIVIGAAGSKREIGFGAAFVASLFLTPLCGLILTAFSTEKAEKEFRTQLLFSLSLLNASNALSKKKIDHDDL